MKFNPTKIALGLLAALLTVYVAMQIYMVVTPSYKTEVAALYELSDEATASGTVVRSESIVTDQGGVKYFLVQDGDKVAKDETIAETYSDSDIALKNITLNSMEEELEALEKLSNTNRGSANLTTLRSNIYSELTGLNASISEGDYSNISSAKSNLIGYLSSYAMSSGYDVNVEKRMAELELNIAEYNAQDLSPSGYITSPKSGFFISYIDGCEKIANTEELDSLDYDALSGIISESKEKYSVNSDYYKILEDYVWYFVCEMSSEQAERLKTGRSYTISFLGNDVEEIPGKVYKVVSKEGEDTSIVILSFERLNSDYSQFRNEDISLRFYSYRGIKVDRSSLRQEDGEIGVYIKYGNVVKFRKLDIIYEEENFVISRLYQGSDNYLSLYDEIIVAGKDLYVDKNLSAS